LTIPTVTGVVYTDASDGTTLDAGANSVTEDMLVKAVPEDGYKFPALCDDDWFIDYS
jgi:hypothetical protein